MPVAGAVLVTTPQAGVAGGHAPRGGDVRKLKSGIGLIENMSYFVCPRLRPESDIFGTGGGEGLAAEMSVPFLGRIPLYQADP